MRRLVRPPSPCVTPSRENTLFAKPVSVAMSNAYDSGRGPLLPAFSISRVTGCFSTEIFVPGVGSSIFGAEISMPGIGPATDGLSGFELLLASQAVSARAAARTPQVARVRDITFTSTGNMGMGSCAYAQMCALRHYREDDFRPLERLFAGARSQEVAFQEMAFSGSGFSAA